MNEAMPFSPKSSEADTIHNFIKAHNQKPKLEPGAQFFLSGPEAGDRVALPAEIFDVLVKAVSAMQSGMTVTITPNSITLTTQQAAEILGVTRPTVVRFLDAGKIPFERPGTHRRIKLEDLMEFKAARKAEQYSALERLGEVADENPAAALDRTKKARALAGQRRRDQSI